MLDIKIDRDGLTAVAQIVVLALSPEEVLKVNLAKETGILNLSLRDLSDSKDIQTPGFDIASLRARGRLGEKSTPDVEP